MSACSRPFASHEHNETTRVRMLLANWIAFDPASGAHLVRSGGRRRFGRPTRYWLVGLPGRDRAVRLAAFDDATAIEQARALLPSTPEHN